ncbi:MAG: hypothetical protein CMB13_01260 [Euryarchaeota archaeon]|nr:hypothetical protein [Euryarchaeota archaeon]
MFVKNPFDSLTNWSIDKPKSAVAVFLALVLGLSMFIAGPIPESLGVGIEFDNSEDAFFPARESNEDVDLLYTIEETYTSSIDIVRMMVEFEPGALENESTWMMLAELEAVMLEHSNSSAHRLDTGIGSVLGPASAAYGWSMMVDPENVSWLNAIDDAMFDAFASNTSTFSENLVKLQAALDQTPMEPVSIEADTLREWTPEPGWLQRMDQGLNRLPTLGKFSPQAGNLRNIAVQVDQWDNASIQQQISDIENTTWNISMFHIGMQNSIPYKELILSTMPTKETNGEEFVLIPEDDRWSRIDVVTISMFIDNEPGAWGEAVGWDSTYHLDEPLKTRAIIDKEIQNWTVDLENDGIAIAGEDAEISGISFARFELDQNSAIGAQIGQLLGMSVILLSLILLTQFRTGRDTALVLFTTILGIIGTYGISGILKLTFNAAMNSIPILLIAIGVDYGIHVVARYREVVREEGERNLQGCESLRDFPKDMRVQAIRKGAILTSGALLIAIFTDMVGFLSFRFSDQKFLIDFGTVIAIGLFMIYFLSITLLPALLRLTPPAKLNLKKAANVEPGRIGYWFGSLTQRPAAVLLAALALSVPMGYAVTTLEVGFDTRDQLDDSIPVVEDFLVLFDRYDAAPAPIYVRYDPSIDLFSAEGWSAISTLESTVNSTPDAADVSSIRSTLESAATNNPNLAILLDSVNSEPNVESHWANLSTWALTNETGRELTSRYMPQSGDETVIQFSTATLDWSDTVAFEASLVENLNDANVEGEIGVAGRPLVLAQVTEGVASAAVLSTVVVAGVILLMLIGLQTADKRDLKRGSITGIYMWIPLGAVVIWVYGLMGLLGYELNAQTVTIGALTLGLGVDYAVHYAHRYEEEREANPSASPEVWVARTTVTTGRAMAGAAITTAGGFAVLNLSALVPLRLFGQVFLVAITLALISSLILLPVLLSMRPGETSMTSNTDESE